MGALALALLSGLSWGTGDFLGGLMTRRLGVAVVMAIAQGAGLVLTGLLILVLGEPAPEARFLLYGVLAGLSGTAGLAALYQGLAIGPMSIVAPIASLSVMVPVLAGFAQGDRPAPLQFVGMACAITGIVLALQARRGWWARIAARQQDEPLAADGLAGDGESRHVHDEVGVQAADDDDGWLGHRAVLPRPR